MGHQMKAKGPGLALEVIDGASATTALDFFFSDFDVIAPILWHAENQAGQLVSNGRDGFRGPKVRLLSA